MAVFSPGGGAFAYDDWTTGVGFENRFGTFTVPNVTAVSNVLPDDAEPPTVTLVSPAEGLIPGSRAVASATPVVIEVRDASDVAITLVFVQSPDDVVPVLAFDGSTFLGRLAGASTATPIPDEGLDLELLETGGWHDAFEITVMTVDKAGNPITEVFTWTLPDPDPAILTVPKHVGRGGLSFLSD